jgi:hypothetical protein
MHTNEANVVNEEEQDETQVLVDGFRKCKSTHVSPLPS